MGRTYDLTHVEETQFINNEGEYTLKVVAITAGTTSNGNAVEKVTFKSKEGLQISDEFVITDKALWKLKIFTKALKLPNVTDTDTWLNRYVVATVVKEGYVKNDGTRGEKHVIARYEPSKLTNSPETFNGVPVERKHTDYQPKPEPKPEVDPRNPGLPVIDIDDEQIPF